jgi:transcriptional enhancer factor
VLHTLTALNTVALAVSCGIHHSCYRGLSRFALMAEWQPDCIISQDHQRLESVGGGPGRALQNTSGNAQSYSDGSTNGEWRGRDDHLYPLALKFPQAPSATHLPHSISTSSLHDSHILAARLHAKKLRRLHSAIQPLASVRPKRSYLKSQKYLEYRARPRRDTGKDGEPVWSDALEDAFQQGMYQLPRI